MGERVAKSKIKREPGYLYYVKFNEVDGCIEVWRAILKKGGKKKLTGG